MNNEFEFDLDKGQLESLFAPKRIREQSERLLELCLQGEGQFRVHLDRLPEVANYVINVTKEKYPDLKIPYHSRWGHFQVGGIDRVKNLVESLKDCDLLGITKSKLDLVIVSVLLDAGAGTEWRYREPSSNRFFARSEGLAVASFDMFVQGKFSSDLAYLAQADGPGLLHLTESVLADSFQVSVSNPLLGLPGRLKLLHQLGHAVEEQVDFFGGVISRPGNLVDYLLKKYPEKIVKASDLLGIVLESLGCIWPGRLEILGQHLGDVWVHKKLGDPGSFETLVPFHKLSQWLTYSLLEPLEDFKIEVTDLNELTALAEYRNGGLLVDTGLIEVKDAGMLKESHHPSSEIILEWRALTIALIDRLADLVRENLNLTKEDFPLVKVLEGGTWWAGRKAAQKKRSGGEPPLEILSDGTVF